MTTRCVLKRTCFMFAIAAMTTGSAAQSQARQPDIAPIYSHPYGQTYSEWAADWWQVALETPASVNPITDNSGEHCDEGNMGNVWFLFGSLEPATIERSCEIPFGTALFFPVVSVFQGAFLNDPPEERTEEFIRARVDCVEQAASTLQFEFNGTPVPVGSVLHEVRDFLRCAAARRQHFRCHRGADSRTPAEPERGCRILSPAATVAARRLRSSLGSLNRRVLRLPVEQNVTYHLTIKPGPRG